MMCPCGNATTPARNKRDPAILRYERCGACGRCGCFVLNIDDHHVAGGQVARKLFQDEEALARLASQDGPDG